MSESTSPRTPQQALATLLARHASKHLLLVGVSRLPVMKAFIHDHPQCQLAHSPTAVSPAELAGQRFGLALSVDYLKHLPRRTGLQLLTGMRNLNANRVAVPVDLGANDWQETDFFALATQNSERFQREGQTLALYTYDLYEYKQAPDWLNVKFWIDLENFGKYQ